MGDPFYFNNPAPLFVAAGYQNDNIANASLWHRHIVRSCNLSWSISHLRFIICCQELGTGKVF